MLIKEITTDRAASLAHGEIAGRHVEVHERGGGCWVIDREALRYLELPPDRNVDLETFGLPWTSFLEVRADEATGDLVIRVTPTHLVRLSH